jgi:hypothetical protein
MLRLAFRARQAPTRRAQVRSAGARQCCRALAWTEDLSSGLTLCLRRTGRCGFEWGVTGCEIWVMCSVGACEARGSQAATCVILSLTALGVDRGGRCQRLHFMWAGHLLDGRRCDQPGALRCVMWLLRCWLEGMHVVYEDGMYLTGDWKRWALDVTDCLTWGGMERRRSVRSLQNKAATCVMLKLSALGVDRGCRFFGLYFMWAGNLLDGHRCDQLGHADVADGMRLCGSEIPTRVYGLCACSADDLCG